MPVYGGRAPIVAVVVMTAESGILIDACDDEAWLERLNTVSKNKLLDNVQSA